jgi:ABC-type Fe3+-hydroxamate transport system substrate-binding protein
MREFITALTAVATLALAGCSSSTPAGSASASAASDKPLTMTEVEAKVGCTDVKSGDVQVGTKEAAICTVDGHDVYLYTFGDDAARDGWLKVAKAAGALGTFAQGTSWVAQTM